MASVIHGLNTKIFKEEWAVKLQEQLDANTTWKEVCNVIFTDFQTINKPYHVDATVQTLEPGTAYTNQGVTETNQALTINVHRVLAQHIDRMDLSAMTYLKQMEMAERQGVLLNEAIETYVLEQHGNWTNFDNASIGGSAGSITLSASNVDDVITGIVREIREAAGESLLQRNGGFIVWRPAHFEIVQRFAMANGFSVADNVLKNGIRQGFYYMGMEHYSSNFLSGGHVFAGVKKLNVVGILRGTYKDVQVNEQDPGLLSGVSVVSRVDFGVLTPNNFAAVLFDVTCNL